MNVCPKNARLRRPPKAPPTPRLLTHQLADAVVGLDDSGDLSRQSAPPDRRERRVAVSAQTLAQLDTQLLPDGR